MKICVAQTRPIKGDIQLPLTQLKSVSYFGAAP